MPNLSIPAKRPKCLKAAAILAAAAALAALIFATAIPGALAQQDKPAAPSGFAVASGGEGEVVTSWDAHSGANLKDYRLQWREQGGAFKTLQDMSVNALTTSTSHTVAGITAGQAYDFRLRARFTEGKQSHWTQIHSAQAGTASDSQGQEGSQGSDSQRSSHIETPQNLGVEYLDYTSFKISWDMPTDTDISHIKVRRTVPGGGDVTFTIVGRVAERIIARIAPDQTFTVGVRFGTSATDFGPEATLGIAMAPLPSIKNLGVNLAEYDLVTLRLNPTSDSHLDGYRVTRRTKTSGLEPDVDTDVGSVTVSVHDDTSATPGVTYVYDFSYYVYDANNDQYFGPVSSIEVAVPDTLTISVSDAQATEGNDVVLGIIANFSQTA